MDWGREKIYISCFKFRNPQQIFKNYERNFKKWLKIDIFNKWNIVKEILYFYQELCVSENERNEKKNQKPKPKHWNMFISHRQNSKIDNENTKLLDASLLQTM